jgi:hypothetical protein
MNVTKKKTSHLNWRPFEDARVYIQSLGLKNLRAWRAWAKSGTRPDNIPSSPWKIYKEVGWEGLGDWLGTGHIATSRKSFLPFEEARAFVRRLGLKNSYEWRERAKSPEFPDDIPSNPNRTYKDKGWIGIRDWLGIERIYKHKKCSFEEAHDYVRSLGLKRYSDWKEWSKSGLRPDDIPSAPWSFYKGKGWVNMGDWLGTGRIAYTNKVYLPFNEAREFVRKLRLKNFNEWREWAKSTKRPDNIPISPHYKYRNKGWIGYGDWLGTGRIARVKRKITSQTMS